MIVIVMKNKKNIFYLLFCYYESNKYENLKFEFKKKIKLYRL